MTTFRVSPRILRVLPILALALITALAAAGMDLFLLLISNRIGRRTRARRRGWPSKRFAIVLSFALLGGLSLFFVYNARHETEPVQAADTVLTIDISLNSPVATVDSSTPSNGPRVATIWAKVTNSAAGSEAINMAVTLGSFTNGIALLTGQSATYTIPSLAAGSSQSFFWFVTMSTTGETAGTYTVSATASNLSATPTSQMATLTSKDAISAAANKITSVSQSGTAASIGETMTITVEFDLGNVGAPNEAWIQPVSNLNFDASVLRLIAAKVTLEGTPQTQDQLFFTGLSGSNTGSVVYTYQAVGIGSTTIIPYQQASSGGQRKFGPFPTQKTVTGNAFQGTLSVSVSPETGADPGDTVTYTLVVGNDGTGAIGDPTNGNGVIIRAAIPTATTYVTSSVVDDAGFTVQFSTDSGSNWSTTDGGSLVTNVRWILTNGVTGGSTVTDTLQTEVKAGTSDGSSLGLATDFGVGTVSQATTVTSPGVVGATLAVDGTGGGNGSTAGTAPSTISCTSTAGVDTGTCSETVGDNTVVVLTATASGGSAFTGWANCDSAVSNVCTQTVSGGNETVSPNFELNLTLTVEGAGAGNGSVAGTGISCTSTAGTESGDCAETVNTGTVVVLTATADSGSVFGSWTNCDSAVLNVCTQTVSGGNETVSSSFLPIGVGGTTTFFESGSELSPISSPQSDSFYGGTAALAATALGALLAVLGGSWYVRTRWPFGKRS